MEPTMNVGLVGLFLFMLLISVQAYRIESLLKEKKELLYEIEQLKLCQNDIIFDNQGGYRIVKNEKPETVSVKKHT